MNTKVKVGIAAVIVAALVALIVLDQKTAPRDESRTGAAPAVDGTLTVGAPPANPLKDPALRIRDDVDSALKAAEETFTRFRTQPPAGEKKVEKGTDAAPGKEIKPSSEEYVVVDGDSFEKIASKKLGNGKWASLIAEANPSVKATGLRPGQKLVLPAKPEPKLELAKIEEPKKAEEIVKKDATFSTGPKGERLYTVQAGDTLSGISVKVYNTSRHVEKIHDANKERLEDPSMLHVGMKLVMPDLPKKESAVAAGTGTLKTSAVDTTGKKTYTVQPGENLWKIASRIAGDKGIEETMRAIVGLNPDKLKTIGDVVRAGWQLVTPE
jgi:nucleoid-associated protein YgaU